MSHILDWWNELRDGAAPLPYMLIDCAGIDGGLERLPRTIFSELECLFTGELAEELADVGGYLGRLKSLDDATLHIVADLLARQVGLLLLLPEPDPGVAEPSFAQMHRHLRKFNVVYGPDSKPLFWRYYDPRVLPDVLGVLDAAQLRDFFGPAQGMVCTDHEGQVLTLSLQRGVLVNAH